MVSQVIHKRLNEDVQEALRQYLLQVDELALDYKEHYEYIYAEFTLINRSLIQQTIDDSPSDFSSDDFEALHRADQSLLDNIDNASEWVRNLVGDPDEPRAHWWWYLDWIDDEMMDAPDLAEFYSPLIIKSDARSFPA